MVNIENCPWCDSNGVMVDANGIQCPTCKHWFDDMVDFGDQIKLVPSFLDMWDLAVRFERQYGHAAMVRIFKGDNTTKGAIEAMRDYKLFVADPDSASMVAGSNFVGRSKYLIEKGVDMYDLADKRRYKRHGVKKPKAKNINRKRFAAALAQAYSENIYRQADEDTKEVMDRYKNIDRIMSEHWGNTELLHILQEVM